MQKKEKKEKTPKKQEDIEQEDLNDLEKVLSSRCVYCGRKVNLATCAFDGNENPCCRDGC